jgi:FkbM family methyltransferase
MMQAQELARRFQRHLAYQQAQFWKKPLINPQRFISNQLRRFGVVSSPPGTSRRVATFHAPQFFIVTGEGVSEQLAGHGIYEPDLTAACLRLIKPGDVVVDIGMHLGYYTVLFALLVGERGHVHAFEPMASTRGLAQKNVGSYSQVTVHPEAVWSSAETLTFHDYGSCWMAFNSFTTPRMHGFDHPAEKISVQSTTLDAFRTQLGQRVSFVKIDAESAEREVIKGAVSLLKQDSPIVTLEVGDFENQTPSRELIGLLASQGYLPWEFKSGRFQKHSVRTTYTYDNLIFARESVDLWAL